VTDIDLWGNGIDFNGALALADALKVNTSLANINLRCNKIGAKGALALADAFKVNTSLTNINLEDNGIRCKRALALVDEAIARNNRLRHLFLFDAQQMLLSVMCADWCGVVWPYVLAGDDDTTHVTVTPDDVETLLAEFSAVVVERRCSY
jgi:hypothetical protein